MSETISATAVTVELPRLGVGADLAEALGARGLHAQLVDRGDHCELVVRYAEAEDVRLAAEVTHAIEAWIGEGATDLVVQHANGRTVVRPPGD